MPAEPITPNDLRRQARIDAAVRRLRDLNALLAARYEAKLGRDWRNSLRERDANFVRGKSPQVDLLDARAVLGLLRRERRYGQDRPPSSRPLRDILASTVSEADHDRLIELANAAKHERFHDLNEEAPEFVERITMDILEAANGPRAAAVVCARDHHVEWFRIADERLEHRYWPEPEGAWDSGPDGMSPWEMLSDAEDVPARHLAATARGDGLDVVVLTIAGDLWHRRWTPDDRWHDADWLDGGVIGPLTAASLNPSHLEVVARAHDGALVHRHLWEGEWHPWTTLE